MYNNEVFNKMRGSHYKLIIPVFLIAILSAFLFYGLYRYYYAIPDSSSYIFADITGDAVLLSHNIGINGNVKGKIINLESYDINLLANKTLYSQKKSIIKLDNFEISTYSTAIKILKVKTSPAKRIIEYEIYNSSKYFIVSYPYSDEPPSIEVKDNEGNILRINKLKTIVNLDKEWKENTPWVTEVKKDLKRKGLEYKNLKDVFYEKTLPPNNWVNVLYELPSDISYPIKLKIINKPQYSFKLFYFDPFYSGWWNESWNYRSIYFLTNNNNYSLDDYPVIITLNDSNFPWDLAKSDLSDIRVIQFNETTQTEKEIPYFIEYVDWQNKLAYLWIKAENFSAHSTITIFLYHDNPNALDESNVSAVANFVDDFESGSLDTTKWNAVGTVSVETDPTYGNGMMRVEGGNQITGACSNYNVPANSVVGYYARPESTGDWDSGLQVGNIYFISDTGTFGAAPVISTGWSYPSGSQGPDISYHFYRLLVQNSYQEMKDYTSGGFTTNTYSYTPGSLCTIIDSDNSGRDALYDLIYVMELPDNETSVVYNTTEYVGSYNATITYPSNNQKVYRFESFVLNATLGAQGFDLYEEGYKLISDYNDFIKYDSIENVTIVDAPTDDYVELASNGDWYSVYKDWQYRLPINISNPNSNDLTDFQINISIDTASLISVGKMNTTCQDIRFTYYNETSQSEKVISYWIEAGCNTDNTIIWVKIPLLKANANTTIYMYYGNDNVWNESNPDDVFIFFDDFEDLYQDPNKWTSNSYTTEELDPTYGVGVMRTQGGNNVEGSCSVSSISSNIIIDFWMRSESTNDFDSGLKVGNIYFISDSGTGDPCIGDTYCYPSGSQNDTTFHHYRITLLDDSQIFDDLITGNSVSATYIYSPGVMCSESDSDSVDSDVFYDLIYVRKYASNMAFNQYNGSEKINNYVYYENGSYMITLDMFSNAVNYTNITYFAEIPANTTLKVYARTSQDKISWSSWQLIQNGSYPNLPGYMYLQFNVLFNTTDNKTSPKFYGINVSYERVKNSPYAWSQYYSISTPLKQYIDDSFDDFNNYTSKENISVGYDGTLYLSNRTWIYGLWKYRLPINITNPNSQMLYDFQINFNLDTQTLISQGKMRSDCSDIRITYYNITDGKEYPINYWIESGCNTLSTTIWVKIPYVYLNSDTLIYVYYGNLDETNSLSDPNKVFDFYDDFDEGYVNNEKWSGGNTQIVYDEISSSYAAEVLTGNQIIGICTIQTFDAPFIVESHLRPTNTNDFDSGWRINDIYFVTDTSGTGAPSINQGGWTYPSGSQGADTTYHFYRIEMQSSSQTFTDLTNGQSASATYTYTAGSICLINDGDGGASSRYDDIKVRRWAADMNFATTQGNEETHVSSYPSGSYLSKIIDFKTNEYEFNQFYWYGIDDANATSQFYIRTSDDGLTWSIWYLMANNTLIEATPARYVQYKIDITNNDEFVREVIDKVVIEYRVKTSNYIIMQPSSIFSTSNPQTCSLKQVKENPISRTCNVSWDIVPKQEGNYTIRVKVNSTNRYIEDSYSLPINISVYIRTYIVDYSITPNVQGQGLNVTIKAKLVNDLSEPLVGYNLSFYDLTDNIDLGNYTTDSNGYVSFIYTIPSTATLGYHNILAKFYGNDSQFLEQSNETYSLKVSSVPQIIWLQAIPSWQGNNQIVQLRANVTDKVGVDTVTIKIYDSSNTLIIEDVMTDIGENIYEYNFSSWQPDTFKFMVIANNTDGITNSSDYESFVIDVKAEISISTEKEEYENREYVYLNTKDDDWWNTSWLYRRKIKIINENDEAIAYDAFNITLPTWNYISEGKMNPDCSDIRFVGESKIYELEINVTNTGSTDYVNYTQKIVITDPDIVYNLASDGRDIRVFEYPVDKPYSNNTYLPIWVEKVIVSGEITQLILWVKIPEIKPYSKKTLYMYYGNKNVGSISNYEEVFDSVIGEAVIYTLDSNDKTINFINSYDQTPVVISSLNTYNEGEQAFVRIKDVTTTGFTAAIQESEGLDGVHALENASYIAILPGKWIIGGKYVEVGTASVDSNYVTVYFQESFSSPPVVLTQSLTFNESDPVKTREDNIAINYFDVKLEETSDTAHVSETVGYIAMERMAVNDVKYVVSSKYHNQPDATTWTTYNLPYVYSSTPAVVAKIMTENGGDNSHERINNVTTSSFLYKIEEEYGYDGTHTDEDNGYAVFPNTTLIRAIPYTTFLSVSISSPKEKDIVYHELPYWIEEGCDTNNTYVWLSGMYVPSNSYTYVYMYYGNTNAKNKSNEFLAFSYPLKKPIYYVLSSELASADMYISSFTLTNVTAGSSDYVVNLYSPTAISSSDLTEGEAIYTDAPLSFATTSSGNGDGFTPLSAQGTLFIHGAPRQPEVLGIYSLRDDNYAEVYEGSGGSYVLRTNITLSKGQYASYSYDFADLSSILVNSSKPILLHRQAGTSYDFFTVYPAGNEWYGVASQYLVIAAIYDDTNIDIYSSDSSSPSTYTLNKGETTRLTYSSNGDSPALYIKADKPIHALGYADGDGTEGVTFLPSTELYKTISLPQDVEYVAIATQEAIATCWVYNSNGLVTSSTTTYTNANTPYPGKIKFVSLSAGDIINCSSPFFAYYEVGTLYETNAWGPKQHRGLYDVKAEIQYEEDVYVNLKNNGNTTLYGYLYMIVEQWTGSAWSLIFPDGVRLNDRSNNNLRELYPGESINITALWNSNPWYTGDRQPGKYRVYVAFQDSDGNIIRDSYGNLLEDKDEFIIRKAVLVLTDLTHENQYNKGLREYEVGDNIKWVNITVTSLNNTAINTEVELSLAKSDLSYAGFGPYKEVKSCGDIPSGENCTLTYDNSSNGYNITTNLGGIYVFYWNVTMTLDNGDTQFNGTEWIKVHDLRENFTSTLQPVRIYIGKEDYAFYNFTLFNQWSENITDVNVTINCLTFLECNCTLPGQETQRGYCYLNNVTSNNYAHANFTMRDLSSATQGDYPVNVTVKYYNPGSEYKVWEEQAPQTLEIRNQGILAIDVVNYPTSVIRASTNYYMFNASINNTDPLVTSTNVWFNYTLPNGWFNFTGNLTEFNETLESNKLLWNNITVGIDISASLGPQIVTLRSSSDQGQEDFKNLNIEVYANTQVVNVSFSDNNVSVGEPVIIYAKLLYDNGTPLSGEVLNFYDTNESLYIGSGTTDAEGVASITYTVPETASVGLHLINVSYNGNSDLYVLSSYNSSYLDVGLKPWINDLYTAYGLITYGNNNTIYANVSDDDGIDYVNLYLTYPNGSTYIYAMQLLPNGLYAYNLTNLWDKGSYLYKVRVYDVTGSYNESSTETFKLEGFIGTLIINDNESYPPNTDVYLRPKTQKWLFDFTRWRKKIYVENKENYDINDSFVIIELSDVLYDLINEGKLDKECRGVIFSYYNSTINKEQYIKSYVEKCDYAYIYIPYIPANSNATLYMYYDIFVSNYSLNVTDTFTYPQQEPLHVVTSTTNAGSSLTVVSFIDNNYVSDGTTSVVLNKYQSYTFPATDLSADTQIISNGSIYGSFDASNTDALPPLSFAGKKFTYLSYRGTNSFHVYAPYRDALCTIYDGTTAVDSFSVTAGTTNVRNTDITDGNAVIIECDAPVLVMHHASNDAYIFYPADYEWYGVASNYLLISSLDDGVTVYIYKSDGSSTTQTLNRGGTYSEVGLGSQGSGPAVHVIAIGGRIGVSQMADGDGIEATTFLPLRELDREYIIPHDFEYIAVAVPYSYTKCDLLDSVGNVVETHTVGFLSPNYPGKMLFGSGSAGYKLICNESVFAYYEQSSNNRETNILGVRSNRKGYGYNSTAIYYEDEEEQGSIVLNNFTLPVAYYIIAGVEQNTTNGWVQKAVIINDTSPRYLEPYNSYDFSSLWNVSPWNTGLESQGTYRTFINITDKYGHTLSSFYGSSWSYDLFNITTGALDINVTNIKVYNITNSLNPHTSTLDLESEGLNTTFILYVGEAYRFEFLVNVSSESSIWWINETNVSLANINTIWGIDVNDDVWYKNSTDVSERVGGEQISDSIKWNTTQLDGKEDPGGYVIFYLIINLSNASTEVRSLTFKVIGESTGTSDVFTLDIRSQDNEPPKLYQNTYGLNSTEIVRGAAVLAYARWNEEISNALIEYNSTTPTLLNYTISLPSPNPYNWTNYTIDTTPLWLLGNHSVKIYAEDIAGNMNATLPYLILSVYGLAQVTNSYINSTNLYVGESVKFICHVDDVSADPDESLSNYEVAFYNSTQLLGINLTNSSGDALWIYTDYSPGTETITCNISDDLSRFYKIDSQNYVSYTLTTYEPEPPTYYYQNQSSSLVHKGDLINLSVLWKDNYELAYATLEINTSGSFTNETFVDLEKSQEKWANITYQVPSYISPGTIAWREYGNDTSNNWNLTYFLYFDVWGWAKISSATATPSSLYTGNSTLIKCQVVDANQTTRLLEGYAVYFYNSTQLLGINYTDNQGYATWNYTDWSEGQEQLVCNITHNTTLMYNASSQNQGTVIINTVSSGDAEPPYIINEAYGLNVTSDQRVFRDEAVLIYGWWSEEINTSWYEINDVSSSYYTTYYINPPYTDNWTNGTINLNYNWYLGVHKVKLYANDSSGNVNNTLDYLNFTVWGLSQVAWVSPQDGQEVNRSIVYLITNVTDYNTLECIDDYRVDYYDNETPGYYIGSAYTDAAGNCYANFSWDASSTSVGYHTLTAMISDDTSKYYEAKTDTSSIQIIIVIIGGLNTTITNPSNSTKVYKGQTYWFNSTTREDNGSIITPETTTWTDNGVVISTCTNDDSTNCENITYTIPLDSTTGWHKIEVNTSAPYYQRGHDEIWLLYWGLAEVNLTTPINGSTSYLDTFQELTCNVTDTGSKVGIEGYYVEFYVYNDSYMQRVNTSFTDASGIANSYWYVNSSIYRKGGYYDVMCNITNNATLAYDAGVASSKNTVYINESLGYLVVNITFPPAGVRTYVGKDANFTINATAKCYGGNCGDVYATAKYNGISISTTVGDTPFYISDGKGNPRLCGTLNIGDSCNVSFVVNATGDYGSVWNITVDFSSSYSGNNETPVAEVFIGYVILLNVEPSNITQWYMPDNDLTQPYLTPPTTNLDPSTKMNKAANTTVVRLLSGSANANGGLWIKGENLTSSENPGYKIPVYNITRCFGEVSDYPTPNDALSCWNNPDNKLTYTYKQILTSLNVGDIINITFFVDVPAVAAGKYNGTIWFLANATY